MSAIEALYIYDEHNTLLLQHIYNGNPPPSSTLLPLYLQHPTPRPSLIQLPSISTLCYSITQDNILFLSPTSSSTTDPLLVLEFLHRVADALQEFLGTPLIATKIIGAYDIVAQVLNEIADGGVIAQCEGNALRDVVETGPGVLKNLLGSLGAAGASPALSGTSGGGSGVGSIGPGGRPSLSPQISQMQGFGSHSGASTNQSAAAVASSAIPWRRSNVRHTSNELYVDIVESLAVTLAPSGRPLAAFANGSIIFNCKVSGVPDLVLNLTPGLYGAGMGSKAEQLQRVMERAVFHPCVRLSKWKSEGVLSFIPPDGRFALCGYEVDLLGPDTSFTDMNQKDNTLNLPASLDIKTNLGSSGADFEVRVTSQQSSARSPAATSLQSHLSSASLSARGSRPGVSSLTSESSKSAAPPPLEDLTVRVPLPASRIRNVSELRPSKGEAHWSPVDGVVEWKIPSKEFGLGGSAVLRCTVQGVQSEEEDSLSTATTLNGFKTTTYDYDEDDNVNDATSREDVSNTKASSNGIADPQRQPERNKELMPTSATLSFSLKGSLPSGIRVESLLVDNKKSRGLGAEVKPYKGVKYLTVSRDGVEVRC